MVPKPKAILIRRIIVDVAHILNRITEYSLSAVKNKNETILKRCPLGL